MAPLALFALGCFAANSVLARLGLRAGAIDPASFTAIRLLAGAGFLALLTRSRGLPRRTGSRSPLPGAALLFLYAAPFSFAYTGLTTGTGALILFGAVQLTMIGAGVVGGERPRVNEWSGLLIALAGLVALNLPGLTAPPLYPALLMTIAGIAWGAYSLRGRKSTTPLVETSRAFLWAAPAGVALVLLAGLVEPVHASAEGILYAIGSGALASGAGYAAWYAVLPRLSATRAGTIQLSVPVLAALAGILLLHEALSLRLILAGSAILGGIALAIAPRS